MKAVKRLAVIMGSVYLFAGCQKELSIENIGSQGVASGSLKDNSGNCLPATIMGNYVKGNTLTDSNFVVVQVNFTSPGSYKISTDTSNGFSFEGSGVMQDSGMQSITLKGTGTPALMQQTNFAVTFDTSVCMFSVNVTDTTAAAPVATRDYFPTTDYSNWTYANSKSSDTIYVRSNEKDRHWLANNYRMFINTYGSLNTDTSYYRKKGVEYFEYGYPDLLFQVNGPQAGDKKVDYAFLNDSLPVNGTWESPEKIATSGTITGKSKIKFTIEAVNSTLTIGSVTVDSVIQVQREYMFASDQTGIYQSQGAINYFYAKNIGLIKIDMGNNDIIYAKRWEIF